MRCSLLIPLLLIPAGLAAQDPVRATRVEPARCALADSLLGPRVARATRGVQALYLAEQGQSLVFSAAPGSLSTMAGVQAVTGLVRLPERGPVTDPALELTLRVFSDAERLPGTQWLRLVADDVVLGDSLPLAIRRQEAPGLRRVYQTLTVPLTPVATVTLVRAGRVRGSVGGTDFTVERDELRELRGIVVTALCGPRKPW